MLPREKEEGSATRRAGRLPTPPTHRARISLSIRVSIPHATTDCRTKPNRVNSKRLSHGIRRRRAVRGVYWTFSVNYGKLTSSNCTIGLANQYSHFDLILLGYSLRCKLAPQRASSGSCNRSPRGSVSGREKSVRHSAKKVLIGPERAMRRPSKVLTRPRQIQHTWTRDSVPLVSWLFKLRSPTQSRKFNTIRAVYSDRRFRPAMPGSPSEAFV
jgi:hypothetical protein